MTHPDPVDTAHLRALRRAFASRELLSPRLKAEALDAICQALDSAADELDELRKQNAIKDAGGLAMAKLAKEIKDQRDAERAAHAETKRELEEEKKRRESAEKVVRTDANCGFSDAKAHFARYGGTNG